MEQKLGTLYVVATPIGNLEDVTLRSIKILSDVDIVLAEDTRVTRKLLDAIFVFSRQSLAVSQKSIGQRQKANSQRLISYHQHSGEQKKLEILNYLMNGKDIALVTDAGTPGISDPGNELVDYLLSYQPELKVIPIPGPSAVTSALSVCGFNVGKFTFVGFVPKKKGRKLLAESLKLGVSVVFFESPYRIFKTVKMLADLPHPPVRIFIGQELTKLHEKTFRGKLKEAKEFLEAEEKELGRVKGEIVVVLEP